MKRGETHGWSRGGHEDEGAEVGSTLVGKGTGGVDQSTNTVGLDGRADDGGTPGGGSRGSLLGLEELLLGVGSLSLPVGVAEDWAEDGEGSDVVEDGAEGDGRRLNRWEVCADGNVSHSVPHDSV